MQKFSLWSEKCSNGRKCGGNTVNILCWTSHQSVLTNLLSTLRGYTKCQPYFPLQTFQSRPPFSELWPNVLVDSDTRQGSPEYVSESVSYAPKHTNCKQLLTSFSHLNDTNLWKSSKHYNQNLQRNGCWLAMGSIFVFFGSEIQLSISQCKI